MRSCASFIVIGLSLVLITCGTPPGPKGAENEGQGGGGGQGAENEEEGEEEEEEVSEVAGKADPLTDGDLQKAEETAEVTLPEEKKEVEKEEKARPRLRGIKEDVPIPPSTVRQKVDKVHLRAASFNLNRYKNGGRLNSGTPPNIQPRGAVVPKTHNQVLTYLAIENGWDIIALQEVLDEEDVNGDFVTADAKKVDKAAAADTDFPKIAGYKLLAGGAIKDWYGGAIHEHCPIYYRIGGEVKFCKTIETEATGNSKVHWAECTIKTGKKRKFNFGCAHIGYSTVDTEVPLIAQDIKGRIDKSPAGKKFEFILGMDANSFHEGGARFHGSWTGDFKNEVPTATLPSFPRESFTKITKRNGQHGRPNNPRYQIYDWLVFNVSQSLDYVAGSLRVTPVSTQLSFTGDNAVGNKKHDNFNEAWFESFSDHLPVDALFTIKN